MAKDHESAGKRYTNEEFRNGEAHTSINASTSSGATQRSSDSRAEERRSRRTERHVSALLAGARAVLRHRDFASSARAIFDNCKEIIGAASGYVALLSEDGKENDVLFLDSGGRPCTVDPNLPMPIRGLRAQVYGSGKVAYRNKFSSTSWAKYLPAGHSKLDNVLFAPLSIDDEVVGLLGLANKSGGFNGSDARIAATFGELAAIALKNSRTLELLEAGEAELSAILANVPILTLLLDEDRRVMKANSAAVSFSRRNSDLVALVIGEALRCIRSTDDPRGCGFGELCQDCGLRLAAEDTYESGNSHYQLEWSTPIGRDGNQEELTFLATTVLIDKPHKHLLICLEDITERKKGEDALARSEEKYRGVFEHMSEALVLGEIMLDRNGDPYDFLILDCNRPWAALVGREVDALIGKTRREVLAVKDPFWIKIQSEVALTGRPAHFERYSPAMGKWLEVRAYSPVKGQFVQLISDVTERKRVEEIKDEFIGMVSHELKTPLTVVTGAINTVLDDRVDPADARVLLDDAAWGAETMADIVDNLLELSRSQQHRLVLSTSMMDIGGIIGTVVARSSGKSARHALMIDVDPTLPKVPVDGLRLERILDNLIDNAIKYSPDGGEVRISARLECSEVLLCVKDQGIGINTADIGRLFQPFARLETPVSGSAMQGIGLGLVVCKRLIEAHGGRLWVESQGGEGSSFCFTLPLSAGPATG